MLLIALYSPDALFETGLLLCPPERSRAVTVFAAEQSVLRSPIQQANFAKMSGIREFLGK